MADISPCEFDLIVVGTGLQEALLAAYDSFISSMWLSLHCMINMYLMRTGACTVLLPRRASACYIWTRQTTTGRSGPACHLMASWLGLEARQAALQTHWQVL